MPLTHLRVEFLALTVASAASPVRLCWQNTDMPNEQPLIVSENGLRSFACSPVAVVVLVVNDQEQLLFGYHDARQRWEAVSGALEARESILDGAMRELREEMGPAIQARPLGVLHASTFRYDDNAQFMISIAYLMAYEGGNIQPGDDMSGGGYRWMTLDELELGQTAVSIPRERWILRRAVEMYRLWKDEEVVLQEPMAAE